LPVRVNTAQCGFAAFIQGALREGHKTIVVRGFTEERSAMASIGPRAKAMLCKNNVDMKKDLTFASLFANR